MNRISRMAERVVTAIGGRFSMPREFYVPKGEHVVNLRQINPEGTDAVVYTYEDAKGILYGMAFAGKAAKPMWHFRFKNEADRQRRVDETVSDLKERAEAVEKRRKERLEYKHDLKVGDVMVSSWGYDQTNVDFYQVTAVGDRTVKIREIGGKMVGGSGGTDYVVPVPGSFAGPEMTKVVGTGGSVRIESYAWASKWDGKPQYQTAAGFGH